MKYSYRLDEEESERLQQARESLKELGAKNKNDGRPRIIVESHDEMVRLLREASDSNPDINPRVLDAIELFDRTRFFDWDDVPDAVKERIVTPYCFKAPIFAEGQTIPSPHIVVAQASSLRLEDGQRILEIGAGSGYNAAIIAYTAGENAEVYSVEIRPTLVELAKENISKVGLGDRVHILQAEEGVLGAPEESPFDRIYSTVGVQRTSQVEEIIDQLGVDGLLRLPVAKHGNTPKREEAVLWEPGMDIEERDMYFTDPSRRFVRAASYLFKRDCQEITYAVAVFNASGPLIE